MVTASGQVLIKTGDAISSDGSAHVITQEDLLELANTYDPEKQHGAFICLGHSSDPLLGEEVSTDADPAMGWVTKVWVKGNELLGNLELSSKLVNLVKEGYYRYKSLAYYPENHPNNPTPGKKHIRHLALLGNHPPAIKGLGGLILYSETTLIDMKNIDEKAKQVSKLLNDTFKAKQVSKLLNDTLIEGDQGYKGIIDGFKPMPSKDNNYLFDPDKKAFIGQFYDQNAYFNFSITQNGENWSASYQIADEQQAPEQTPVAFAEEEEEQEEQEEQAPTEELTEELEEQAPTEELEEQAPTEEQEEQVPTEELEEQAPTEELTEELAPELAPIQQTEKELTLEPTLTAEQEELARLQAENNRLLAEMQKMEEAKLAEFSENVYALGKITPRVMPKQDFDNLLQAISKASTQKSVPLASFGEGKTVQQVSLFEGFKRLVENLTPLVAMGEMSNEKPKSLKTYSSPVYTNADGEQLETHEKAVAYCEQNGLNPNKTEDYVKAVKVVSV